MALLYMVLKKGELRGIRSMSELAQDIGIPYSNLAKFRSKRNTTKIRDIKDETLSKLSSYLEFPMLLTRVLAGQLGPEDFQRHPDVDVIRDIERAIQFMLSDPWMISILPLSIHDAHPLVKLYLIALYELRNNYRLLPTDKAQLAEYILILKGKKASATLQKSTLKSYRTDPRLLTLLDDLKPITQSSVLGSLENRRKIRKQQRVLTSQAATNLSEELGMPIYDIKVMAGHISILDYYSKPEELTLEFVNQALEELGKLSTLAVPFPREAYALPIALKLVLIWLFEEVTGQSLIPRRITIGKTLRDVENLQQLMVSET